MYRMSSDIAPYATHPDMPQFHAMVAESAAELRALGAKAKALGIRLSFHPSQFVVLNSPDPELVRKSVWDLVSQAEMLDRMELGPEAVMVIHVGGAYGDRPPSNARWVETWPTLPEPVRRRLVLEHDDIRFSAADVLWIHEQTGVRLIFDHQHFWCLNPEGLAMRDHRASHPRTLAGGRTAQDPLLHAHGPSCASSSGRTRRPRRPSRSRSRRSGPAMPTSPPVRVHRLHADDRRGSTSTSCWRPRSRTWR